MKPNTRIVVNTAFIYCRLLVVTILSLFSTRYILLALGETDFGIYNLIAGVVGLFSFISITMAGTTQRYISYYMGGEDMNLVKEVFYNSCVMHIVIALLVALIVEFGGIWCINNILSIPVDRFKDAIFVLHCVTCGLIATIICVPYEAILMAYENILFVSAVHTLKAVIMFAGAWVLLYFSTDRLRIYAEIMAVIPYVYLIVEFLYCHFKYKITRLEWHVIRDYSLIKSMGNFAGWVMVGVTCGTLRTQGSAVLLNMFFGVLVNAANGVALQVNGALQQFSSSVTVSIRPQLTKSIGCHDYGRMYSLTYAACKYPYLLMVLFAVPAIIAMPYLLRIWLKEVPEYSVVLCRLMLLSTMISLVSYGFTSAIEAYGKVKWLHLTVGIMHIFALPIGYILFKLGCPPQTIMWCIVLEEGINGWIRVFLVRHYLQIDIGYYLRNVILRSFLVTLIVFVCDYFIWRIIEATFVHFMLFLLIHTGIYLVCCIHYGLNESERKLGYSILINGLKKIMPNRHMR